jgi:hypothetical protein
MPPQTPSALPSASSWFQPSYRIKKGRTWEARPFSSFLSVFF